MRPGHRPKPADVLPACTEQASARPDLVETLGLPEVLDGYVRWNA